MKVTLVDCTGFGSYREHAIDILIFTKSTRLKMSPGLLNEIRGWPIEKKMKELEYMANTIPSSWEFVDYTFSIEGVTRAFTHQLVRTRTASFAQQTMRVLDVSGGSEVPGRGWGYETGPSLKDRDNADAAMHYHATMEKIGDAYRSMINKGAAIEDARGILPTNILTNIVMKCNLRTFVELVRKRSSPRTQGEYRVVLDAMKAAVLKEHPWAELFVSRTFDKAAKELDAEIAALPVENDHRVRLMKLVDQLRIAG